MHKRIIYLYNDWGTSNLAVQQTLHNLKKHAVGYEISFINAAALVKADWTNKAALLIMPGGRDVCYSKKLNGIGNEIIRTYVATGGSYLGICAGAYYGSGHIVFDQFGPLEIIEKRELAFFPGKSLGPILAPYDYKTYSGARAALIRLNHSFYDQEVGKIICVYYNGGGYFFQDTLSTAIDVIADYQLQDHSYLPAIIKCNYKKGVAVLSAVHFEYFYKNLDPNPYHDAISSLLAPFEYERQCLANYLYGLLGLQQY